MPWLSAFFTPLALEKDNQNLSQRVACLEAELRTERERHWRREDELLDRVLLASGRHSLTPEAKAKGMAASPKPRPQLNAVQEATLVAYRKAAVEAGRSIQEADAVFWAEMENKPLPITRPDEPYILPT